MSGFAETIYNVWAPERGVWSPWVKPVGFIRMTKRQFILPFDWQTRVASWMRWAGARPVIVVDLPGVESVLTGVALASRGYRPIPLFNAVYEMNSEVDMESVVNYMQIATPLLAGFALPDDAPPAFLLDANRFGSGKPNPGKFDNRWVVLPQDFPSSGFLRDHNFKDVLLVQTSGGQPGIDLAHVLLRWQEGGYTISVRSPTDNEPARQITVNRPNWFRHTFYAALAMTGLRRNSAGGFGGVVPFPSSGGGYG